MQYFLSLGAGEDTPGKVLILCQYHDSIPKFISILKRKYFDNRVVHSKNFGRPYINQIDCHLVIRSATGDYQRRFNNSTIIAKIAITIGVQKL